MAVPRLARALAVAGTLAALATPAAASWSLRLDAPADCDDPDGFRGRAEALRTTDGEVAGVAVTVWAWASEHGGWQVRVTVGEAARVLAGGSCREVTEAAALIVALSLDGAAERPPAPPPRPPPPPPLLPGPPPSTPPVRLAVDVVAGMERGALPVASPGARAELRVGWRRASLGLAVAGWARAERRAADGEGVAVSLWQARVAGRVGLGRGVELGGAVEIGQLAAEGVGVQTPLARRVAWQGLGGLVGWRWPLGRGLQAVLEVEGLWPLTRPTFVVDNEPRFTPGPTLRGFAGVGWSVP